MKEADHSEIADTPPDSSADFNTLIASLRTAGAHRFDPVRLHYIEVLARRAAAHGGNVRRMLDTRLAQALAAFSERFEKAQCDARENIARTEQHYPHAADDLQRFFAAGDFKGLKGFIANLETSGQHTSLAALVRQLAPENSNTRPEQIAGSRPELKTIRNFRNTWSKLSADKQVTQALEQAPKNAGPINSHMLVLRSLALMRDISPDYLNRFMSYADTLLSLDQSEKEKTVTPKKRQATRAPKK